MARRITRRWGTAVACAFATGLVWSPVAEAADPVTFGGGGRFGVSEGATATITIQRMGTATGTASVDYTTGGGSATPVDDYTPTSGTAMFADGQSVVSFDIPTVQDVADEPYETIGLTLSNPSPGLELGQFPTATVTIIDDDGPALLTFPFAAIRGVPLEVPENAGSAIFTVERSGRMTRPVTVNYATEASTGFDARPGVDFQPVSGTLVIGENEPSGTIAVPLIDNAYYDGRRLPFGLRLSAPGGGAQIISSLQRLTVTDDEIPIGGTVRLSDTSYEVTEGDGKVTVPVLRTGPVNTLSTAAQIAVSTGTATASDFTALPIEGTEYRGSEMTRSLTVPIKQDTVAEDDETFSIKLVNVFSGGSIGSPAQATITIHDDDAIGPLAMAPVLPGSVSEAALLAGRTPVAVTCVSACSVDAELLMSRPLAADVGAASALVRIGRAVGHRATPGPLTVKLRLTARAKSALRRSHARPLRATLRVTVTGRKGTRRVVRSRNVIIRN